MDCSACRVSNHAGRTFRLECGARLSHACAECGAANASDDAFCGEGGAPPAPAAGPVRACASTPGGDTERARQRAVRGPRRVHVLLAGPRRRRGARLAHPDLLTGLSAMSLLRLFDAASDPAG